MILSKIIKHQSSAYEKASLPEVVDTRGLSNKLTVQNLNALQEQAYQEAYQNGYEVGLQQGFAAGEEQLTRQRQLLGQRVEQLDQLMNMLQAPLQRMDQEVENDLVTLVITLLRQMFRREIKADPAQIVAVIREAMALLPINDRQASLVLHPNDVTLVRSAFSELDRSHQWHIVEDSGITPGGCRVVTENSQVDATVENRLATLIAQVFGGDRERDDAG